MTTVREAELRAYEARVIKEMEAAKAFSWKKLWKAIELSSICNSLYK